MAENAERKHIANCKVFFNAAKRRGLIENNPFEAQVSGSEANRSRDHYMTPDDTAELLKAAPDSQWRLLIALWRLAGLRKMEVFNLTWGDVKRDGGKLLVRSTKTEHHDGCDIRYVATRDVQQYLDDAFQASLTDNRRSLPADAPIITRFSSTNSNMDKPLKLIIEKAGLVPWPKLFQNMRASCETQWLKDGERADLVANWMGHSVKVQNQNYVQHTAEDIEAFNQKPAFKSGNKQPRTDAKPPQVATQVATGEVGKTLKTSVFATQTRSTDYPEQDSMRSGKTLTNSSGETEGAQIGAHWAQIRKQIAACEELTRDAKRELIDKGDQVAGYSEPLV